MYGVGQSERAKGKDKSTPKKRPAFFGGTRGPRGRALQDTELEEGETQTQTRAKEHGVIE